MSIVKATQVCVNDHVKIIDTSSLAVDEHIARVIKRRVFTVRKIHPIKGMDDNGNQIKDFAMLTLSSKSQPEVDLPYAINNTQVRQTKRGE